MYVQLNALLDKELILQPIFVRTVSKIVLTVPKTLQNVPNVYSHFS